MTFANLPTELIVQIFLLLDANDILAAQLWSSFYNLIIKDDPRTQYVIALYAAGLEDNPACKLGIVDRLRALEERQTNWNTLRPAFVSKHRPPSHSKSALMDGVFSMIKTSEWDVEETVGEDSIEQLTLPTSAEGEFTPNTIKVPPNELIFGVTISRADLNIYLVKSQQIDRLTEKTTHVLRIDLVHLSSGEHHELVHQPEFELDRLDHFPTFYRANSDYSGRLVALILDFGGREDASDILYVFDWVSGHVLLKHMAGPGVLCDLCFLSDRTLLIPNAYERHLEVWDIPEQPLSATHPSFILRLPKVLDGFWLRVMQTKSGPGASYRFVSDLHPFYNSPSRSIAMVIFRLVHPSLTVDLHFCVVFHRHKLLDRLSEISRSAGAFTCTTGVLAWEDWTDSITRVIDLQYPDQTRHVTCHGQRLLIAPGPESAEPLRILDFNQNHVRRSVSQNGLIGRSGKVLGRDVITNSGFEDSMFSTLRCVEITAGAGFEDVVKYDLVLLDERRVVGVNWNDSELAGRTSLLTMYFG